MTRKTRDLCGDCWAHVNPNQYFPPTRRFGTCDRCGQNAFVSRSWIAHEAAP
jgi:NMD protein affecting ribosome stability and mRNA decay